MKKKGYMEFVCKRFCSFYKPGSEALACAGYLFFENAFALEAIKDMVERIDITEANPTLLYDSVLRAVCRRCDFLADGCDFREGIPSPPCGGYILLESLIREGILTEDELNRILEETHF